MDNTETFPPHNQITHNYIMTNKVVSCNIISNCIINHKNVGRTTFVLTVRVWFFLFQNKKGGFDNEKHWFFK